MKVDKIMLGKNGEILIPKNISKKGGLQIKLKTALFDYKNTKIDKFIDRIKEIQKMAKTAFENDYIAVGKTYYLARLGLELRNWKQNLSSPLTVDGSYKQTVLDCLFSQQEVELTNAVFEDIKNGGDGRGYLGVLKLSYSKQYEYEDFGGLQETNNNQKINIVLTDETTDNTKNNDDLGE